MWQFKRKTSTQSPIPNEVQEYYQAERRERVGIAWLLAFATLVTTLLVAVGLFFGGRSIYRRFTEDNKPKPVAVTPSTTKSSPAVGSIVQPAQPSSPQPPTNPQNINKTQTSVVEDSDAGTPVAKTPTTQAPSKQTEPLPKTGPTETMTVFVAVSVLATTAHYAHTKRKLNR